VDPEAHVDLHELGMEFCSEALEQAVTSEEAQPLFEASACKFQEVAALAFFNWGNVHMCAARKRIVLEENDADKSAFNERLEGAFEWARSQYEMARSKYEESVRVKPDFYEGVLALGQESFENAKLRWSLAMAKQLDLATWDSSETVALFKHAEEKMHVAFEMWEAFEDRKLKEISAVCEPSLKPDPRGKRDCQHKLSESETKEQLRATRFQINLFWGNILFEHSQVEFKLGLPSWKALLDMAVQKFELAGASPSDIIVVLKNHVANVALPRDGDGDSRADPTNLQENMLEIKAEFGKGQ
jgi:tetratricopeptide (TPR) repeat protein